MYQIIVMTRVMLATDLRVSINDFTSSSQLMGVTTISVLNKN